MARQIVVLACAASLLSSVMVMRIAAEQGKPVDPPAITVFPDHDRIGTPDYPIARAVSDGRKLFRAKFNVEDGAGRPDATGDSKPTPRLSRGLSFQRVAGPDANSCAGCHNDPVVGGSGEFVTNTFVGAHLSDPPSLSAGADITNERNTVTLFGSGAVELVAREMTEELMGRRDTALAQALQAGSAIQAPMSAKGTPFGSITAHPDGYVDFAGLEGVDYTLIVRPFGLKGVAASLREFTTFALNQHHGIQAVERFGWERTGVEDFDGDGRLAEFTVGQVTAMVLFQATLPPPIVGKSVPNSEALTSFVELGCASCHIPMTRIRSNVFTEPGPFNRPGALNARDTTNIVRLPLDLPEVGGEYVVPMYSDLKRHQMCDQEVNHLCNERLRQDNVPQELFMTAKLWDLATSAPYCHRGDCGTISEAILAHGGEGRSARDNYRELLPEQQRALVAFLLSLGADQVVEQ